jgi:hypothetical protein
MDYKKDNIDRYFKERLREFEQRPPEASWNRIAQKLGHNRRKVLGLLFFRIAASMTILISTGIGYYLITKPAGQSEPEVLSINKDDVAPKNVIELSVPVKRNPVKVTETKSDETERLSQIRMAYKGPAMSEAIAIEPIAQPVTKEIVVMPDSNYQSSTMTSIINQNKKYLLPVDLPFEFEHNRSLSTSDVATDAAKDLSVQEALALLMPDNTEAETEMTKPDRWTLGSEVAPLYSYRNLSSDHLQSDQLDNLNESESGLLAYAGGIRVAFSTGKRLSVQSGIYYSRYGQQINKVGTYSVKYFGNSYESPISKKYISVANSTGIISSDNPENAEYDIVVAGSTDSRNEFNGTGGLISADNLYPSTTMTEDADMTLIQYFDYLELPLLVKYKIFDHKIDFSFSGGLVTNFLIGNSVNIKQDGESTRLGETTDIRHVNYQGSFGLGIDYPITSGFALTIEPRFRYYLNPIDKSPQINVHPFSFGFFAGVSYVF